MRLNRVPNVKEAVAALWTKSKGKARRFLHEYFEREEALAVLLVNCLTTQEFGSELFFAYQEADDDCMFGKLFGSFGFQCDKRIQDALSQGTSDFFDISLVDLEELKRLFDEEIPCFTVHEIDTYELAYDRLANIFPRNTEGSLIEAARMINTLGTGFRMDVVRQGNEDRTEFIWLLFSFNSNFPR